MSAPVRFQAATEARELEARFSLPVGAIGDLAKPLGKGLLSSGVVTGLLSLLGNSYSSSSTSSS